MKPAMLEVKHLKTYFKVPAGQLHAVDDVSFTLEEGRTLGLVGESGCGKSTLGRTLIHLQESTDGMFSFRGEDITHPTKKKLKQLRRQMQIIFQDPLASLNPRMTVQESIMEPLVLDGQMTKAEIAERTKKLMELVGLAPRLINCYPHELDGGRRQRIGIARALALRPQFLVCDEPVSALDVSIQAQILNLMRELQERIGLTYLFITHDLSVVNYISDEIAVMYCGQIVEKCSSDSLFQRPLHPYTQALLSAIPIPDIHAKRNRILLRGEVAMPINPNPGCRFAPRCPYAGPQCTEPQSLLELEHNHFAACCQIQDSKRC